MLQRRKHLNNVKYNKLKRMKQLESVINESITPEELQLVEKFLTYSTKNIT